MLDGKVVDGTHEKLISHEVFLKVNEIRQQAVGMAFLIKGSIKKFL